MPLHGRVQRDPERPQVRGGAGLPAQDALGGQELRGAHQLPGHGQRRAALDDRDAEIGEDHPTVVGEEHIAGLHVPVQHPRHVRRPQRGQHLHADAGRPRGGEGPLRVQHLRQRQPAYQLHHDPRAAVLGDHVVNGDDIGVRDGARGPPLALQARV